MEMTWIRSFVTVAETLHFGRAGIALGLSQSALSVQIKHLEEDLQVDLFVRDRRSVSLTTSGAAFLDTARGILKQVDIGRHNARRAKSGEIGLLRIGFVNSATFGLLPKIIRYYKEQFPGVELSLRNLPTAEQGVALLKEDIDIGFLRMPFEAKGIDVHMVSQEPFYCFLPKNHPLSKSKRISPAVLREEPFILYERRQAPGFCDRVLKICNDAGFNPHAFQEASEMQTILSLVASGLGVSLLPRSAGTLSESESAILPLTGKPPLSETGMASLSARQDNPLLATFRRVTHDLTKELLA